MLCNIKYPICLLVILAFISFDCFVVFFSPPYFVSKDVVHIAVWFCRSACVESVQIVDQRCGGVNCAAWSDVGVWPALHRQSVGRYGIRLHGAQQSARSLHLRLPLPDERKGLQLYYFTGI